MLLKTIQVTVNLEKCATSSIFMSHAQRDFAEIKDVDSDIPKHANTSSETEFAGMEKDALMRIKESVLKIRKLKKLRKNMNKKSILSKMKLINLKKIYL